MALYLVKLVPLLLFNSPSTTCILVHYGVCIISPHFLQVSKEPLQHNYFKNKVFSGLLYLPSHVLIPLPHESSGYWNIFFPLEYFICGMTGNVRHNGGLPPMNVLFDGPQLFHLQGFLHWCPLPYDVPSTSRCISCNFSDH